ncbi:MAG: T9SS type A sorting domain-containing protein, partial [Pedobacter sp.]
MHGFSLMSMVLTDLADDVLLVTTALEAMMQWKLQERNKVDDSGIQEPVLHFAQNEKPLISGPARKLLDYWSTLTLSYRIARKPKIASLDEEDDAATTIITNNVSAGTINPDTGLGYGTSLSQTMAIFGNDFTASKITIANTFVNSNANAAINANTQAVALKTQGDRQAFYDCRILGFQDTYLGNSIGRAYFKNSYIEGNVDFIFGRQTVVFDQCTTYINRNNSVVVAPSTEASTKFGFVFLDCNLTVPAAGTIDFNGTAISNFHFGRPWQNRPKAAFIRSVTPAMLNPVGWTTMNAGLNPTFVEYGSTGAGATPDKLVLRGNEGVVINATQAQVFTMENVFKKETDPSFVFDWMPASSVSIDFGTLAVNNIKDAKLSVYPNPFTNQVTIAYDLKSSSDVSVMIYDANGRMVKNIRKANQKSGV